MSAHSLTSAVFFYGLFMDPAVLEAKGLRASGSRPGFVRDWRLRIGRRATMVPDTGHVVHGVTMTMSLRDLERLYAEASVEMYRPAAVLVEGGTAHARPVAALAYVLPEELASDHRNPEYAAKLRALAERLRFPADYILSIR